MPPKVRKDCEASVTSDVSISNESSTSTVTISTDALERILSANTQTLSDILSKLPGMLSHTAAESTTPVLVAPVSKTVKVPVWSDDQQPLSYLTKYEKAMVCNGENKSRWAHLLPMYISGKLECAYTRPILLMTMMS